MSKIAIFTAGDKNIFFPAFVALTSIMKHNPDIFDAFICIPKEHLSFEMENILYDYGIKYVSVESLDKLSSINNMPLMKENKWPKEIFLNWIFPYYLNELNYKHSIKVDYDLLCIDQYSIDDILPDNSFLSGLHIDISYDSHGVSDKVLLDLEKKNFFIKDKKTYINAGFVVIDNEKYASVDFYNKFKEVYIYLLENCPKVILAEQVALSIVLSKTEGIKNIGTSYNMRVYYTGFVKPDLIPNIKNIHYFTSFKPWVGLPRHLLKDLTANCHGMLPAYRAIWLHYASQYPFFADYCNIKPYTHEQMLGVSSIICYWYNRKIEEQQKTINELRNECSAPRESKNRVT